MAWSVFVGEFFADVDECPHFGSLGRGDTSLICMSVSSGPFFFKK